MIRIRDRVRQILYETALRLEAIHLLEQADVMRRLAAQADEPCVVAVAGRVKAGKSSFINALLGEDLAKTGSTETTATINYFRYGVPNPDRPVRCYWLDGTHTEETREFLDTLQGNDEATLKRASGIHHLEYILPNAFLQETTLVDTPGTGALVEEHENRTAEYIRLAKSLRQRHDEDTRKISNDADAVIYLVGAAAGETDKSFLEQFAGEASSGARALNAVGVMAKIDISQEFLKRRNELAKKVAVQLREQLNTVVPVSAGLARAIRAFSKNDLEKFIATIKRFSSDELEFLLDSDELYLSEDAAVSREERVALLGHFDWTVFTTLARAAASAESTEEMISSVEDFGGFDGLDAVLRRHFFARGTILRCFRIVRDARDCLSRVRYRVLPNMERNRNAMHSRLEKFLAFLGALRGDDQTLYELSSYLQDELRRNHTSPTPQLDEIDRSISELYLSLEDHNLDFGALQIIEERKELFAEQDELSALFGRYGLENADRVAQAFLTDASLLETRQSYWRGLSLTSKEPEQRMVADRAEARYGHILRSLVT